MKRDTAARPSGRRSTSSGSAVKPVPTRPPKRKGPVLIRRRKKDTGFTRRFVLYAARSSGLQVRIPSAVPESVQAGGRRSLIRKDEISSERQSLLNEAGIFMMRFPVSTAASCFTPSSPIRCIALTNAEQTVHS